MILESYIAFHKKLLSSNDLQDISEYIFLIFGAIVLPDADVWLPLIKQDKKNKGNKILMALPKQVGRPYGTLLSARKRSVTHWIITGRARRRVRHSECLNPPEESLPFSGSS